MRQSIVRALALAALATAVVVVVPLLAAEADDSAIIKIEHSLWEGWKNHDPAAFEANVATGALNITASSMQVGKAALIAQIKSTDCKVTSYSLGKIAVHHYGEHTAILTYQASQDVVCSGQKLPSPVQVSAVYFKDGGSWKSASYHESVVPPRTDG